jgi:hypothetical protein
MWKQQIQLHILYALVISEPFVWEKTESIFQTTPAIRKQGLIELNVFLEMRNALASASVDAHSLLL